MPLASVIVPTFQRPAALADCLEALARLDASTTPFEVIVVNDGGHIDQALIAFFRTRLDLQLVNQANAGPAAARNAGAARARGRILAFTDDDCAPAPPWLQRLCAAVLADSATLAGGRTLNALHANPFSSASQILVDFLYEYYNRGESGPQFFTSNNFALSAERFRAMGGFDTSFPRAAGEDRDFCDHWRRRGGRLCYEPAAIVHHAHHLSLGRFWRQHFTYGSGARRFHLRRAARGDTPVRVEPLSFYSGLVFSPFRRGLGMRAPLLAGLMLLSQVANVAGYVAERRAERRG